MLAAGGFVSGSRCVIECRRGSSRKAGSDGLVDDVWLKQESRNENVLEANTCNQRC